MRGTRKTFPLPCVVCFLLASTMHLLFRYGEFVSAHTAPAMAGLVMLHRALENNTVTHKGDKTAIGAALHALNVSSFWGMLQPDKMGQNPNKMIGVVQVKEYDQPAALVGPVMAATRDWRFDTQLEYPYEAWAREPPPPQAPSPGLMVHIIPRNTTQPERRGRVLRLFMFPPAQEQVEALASKIWLQLVGVAAVVAVLAVCVSKCVTKHKVRQDRSGYVHSGSGAQPLPAP